MASNFGTFPYGSNPVFTVTVQYGGINNTPASVPIVKLTDPNSNHIQPTLVPADVGVYKFLIPGGAVTSGAWSGRAYVTPGDPDMASVDFQFSVDTTVNP